jgi:hypothetical protein
MHATRDDCCVKYSHYWKVASSQCLSTSDSYTSYSGLLGYDILYPPRMAATHLSTVHKTHSVCTIAKNLNAFITNLELGAYSESLRAPLSFALSIAVPLSAFIGAVLTGRISVKFDTGDFYKTLSKSRWFGYNWWKISGTLHEVLSTFYYC